MTRAKLLVAIVPALAAGTIVLTAAGAPQHRAAGTRAAAHHWWQAPAHESARPLLSSLTTAQQTTWVGGPQSTTAGTVVTVYVAAGSTPDPAAAAARWAELLTHLLHGPELASLQAYFAPKPTVEEACRARGVLGCYSGNRMVSISEPVRDVTPEHVARHEYGHHVAAHRQNPPWPALDWGPKRWASEEDVCARSAAGTAFPGDEDLRYDLNPGEAFAEAYRVADERRTGQSPFTWNLIDPSFSPDDRALAAVEGDVVDPWTAPRSEKIAGAFVGRSRVWTRRLETPLDGDLEVRLRVPLGAGHSLALVNGTSVVARGAWTGTGARTLRYRVCGQRSLTLRVVRAGPRGRFSVTVAAP